MGGTLKKRFRKWQPLAGGVATALIALGANIALGSRGDFEALRLLEAAIPTVQFLCSALIAASATILALMLTLLGLSLNMEKKLVQGHYLQVKQIARWATLGFLASVLLLVLLTFPLEESDTVPVRWYDVIYYAVLAGSSLLAGYLSVVVLLLYNTIASIIDAFGLAQDDHPLVAQESDGPETDEIDRVRE